MVFDHDFESRDDMRTWMVKSFTKSKHTPYFVWKPYVGETSTPDTGPFHDHTLSPQTSGRKRLIFLNGELFYVRFDVKSMHFLNSEVHNIL